MLQGKQEKIFQSKDIVNSEVEVSLCALHVMVIFIEERKIGIVGCGPYMKHELEYLSRMTKDITIFTHGNTLDEDLGFPNGYRTYC